MVESTDVQWAPTHRTHPPTQPAVSLPQNLAVFTVESKWRPNKPLEAKQCYGTTSIEHPAVQVHAAAGLRRGR